MKRRISPARYTSMLYPDIASYRGALIDVGQVIAALGYGLRKGIVPDVSARQLGWGDWLPEETRLSDLIEQCEKAVGVLGCAVDVADRVAQGIGQAMVLSDAALRRPAPRDGTVLREDAVNCGLSSESASPTRSKVADGRLSEASHYEQVVTLLRRIAERKSAVPPMQVTRARSVLATLREAERMKKRQAQKRKGSEHG